MSQQLQPSTAAITAADLPDNWIEAVRSAVRRDSLRVREGETQIEVYSERTKEWHPLSPVFINAIERKKIFLAIIPV